MKKNLIIIILLFVAFSTFAQKINFDEYFLPKTLRFDYIHAGNSKTETVYLKQFKEEPYWGGSQTNTIDPFNYGEFRLMVYDLTSNKLIFAQGYATLFQEWQATEEAQKISRSFYESVTIPYPKNSVKIVIEKRDRKNKYTSLFEIDFIETDFFVKKEKVYDFKTSRILDNGDPSKNVDIVIIPEGYTKQEMSKFRADAQRFSDAIFNYSPFDKYKNKFNIHIIEAYSKESGTDIPGKDIWKNTIVNSSFYTFGIERYITTTDVKSVRDIASLVPYDQIYILVNSTKYGGGGIYNFYNLCVADNFSSELIFVHEFGHGFGGLADEYWTSDVGVQDYYDLTVEPADPNITTLVDFESKWKHMVNKNTPIPTPSDVGKYRNKVGAFEGGGYVEKGIYRSSFNCYMKALDADNFCPVCQDALERMIKFYTE